MGTAPNKQWDRDGNKHSQSDSFNLSMMNPPDQQKRSAAYIER
jgi:hypothetical protein